MISAQLHTRVIAKIQEGIKRAEAAYERQFPMPKVVFKKRGTTAGTASYRTWTIDLNAGLLVLNPDEFIERTVPHELAHLLNDRVYPESHQSVGFQRVLRNGRWIMKRGKRDVHGETWRSVCRVLGMSDIARCHQYDTSTTRVVKSNSRQIEWKCSRCGEILKLTPQRSAKLDASPAYLWHRPCKGARLVRVTAQPQVNLATYGAVVHPSLPKTTVILPPAPGVVISKIDLCKQLYTRNSSLSRSEMIAKFVSVAGCTPAGAGTYYATCKKVYG